MNLAEVRIAFGGHALVLHAHGVLYWPKQKTLVASDLHFEKATFLARHGSLIPPYDTADTLARLEQLLAHYQPERLILLGDSFHDAGAWQRLDAGLRERIVALTGRVRECIWIEGNHDVALQAHPLGTLTAQTCIEGLTFAHDDAITTRPLIIGHYHPKTKLSLGRQGVRGKCFVHSDRLLVMPSFGSYTGGLDIGHDAIRTLFEPHTPRTYLLYRDTIYPVPSDRR